MAENTNLVEAFMSKMSERNAMSIAADTKYSPWQAEEKLDNKFGFKRTGWEGKTEIDGETFDLFRIDDHIYAKDDTGTYWNVDSRVVEKEVPEMEDEWYYTPEGDRDWAGEHPTGRMITKPVTEYQINSTVTDPKVLEYFKAISYVNSSEREELFRKGRAAAKDAKDAESKQAFSIIKVNVTDGKFTDPESYIDDVEDESWSCDDDEADFDITITVGSTPIFEGLACSVVSWEGGSELTYYQPATMYRSNGDPGDPEESSGVTRINYAGLSCEFLLDKEENEFSIEDLAEKVPEGKFRNMFIKYGKQVVESALEDYVLSHSEDVEHDW